MWGFGSLRFVSNQKEFRPETLEIVWLIRAAQASLTSATLSSLRCASMVFAFNNKQINQIHSAGKVVY